MKAVRRHHRPPTLRSLFAALVLLTSICVSWRARAQTADTPASTTPAPLLDPAPDLAALVGKPVSRVAVILEGNIWDDVEVPQVTSVKAGQPFKPAGAREALNELLASGRFARGHVLATADGGGVLVVVRVVPRKLIGKLDVDLHGAQVDREELLREAEVTQGGELVGADVDETRDRIRRFLAHRGYPTSRVDLETRATDDPARALLIVDVDPGPPRRIDGRHFYVFGATDAQVLPVTSVYNVRPNDRADEPAIDAADLALMQALRAKGWSRATVSHDLFRERDRAGAARAYLRVRIDSGPLQVPTFEGNDHYDGVALNAALGLDADADHSPSHLADKLRIFYQKRGFLDVEVRPEVRGGDNDAVQLQVFHVTEHARVRVARRRYPCLKLDVAKRLSNGGPRAGPDIGTEIDSFLEEDLPGADLVVDPDPQGLSLTVGEGAGQIATGARPEPIDLHPDATYVADTYERATEHVQELYRNEGFLHAQVGPVQIVRARCNPRSPPGRCIPIPLPPLPTQVCAYDASGLPLPAEPLDPAFTCQPDNARGASCASMMQLVIPVKLGPRTTLWDVGFTGVRTVSEQEVATAAEVPLGEPVSTEHLDEARRRIGDWYKEKGYAYVDVKYVLEPSVDNTRARVRFDVTEGDRVIVRDIVIRGLERTRESVVRRRIAVEIGQPYRTSDVRKTQERMATLGVFSSITLNLSEPYVPQANKTVVIDVVERLPRYIEVRPGFSTGEGVRGTLEYDERDILGYGIGATFRAQLSYLPDFLILDPQVATNYAQIQDRLARRITLSGTFPDVGLGPLIRAQGDAIYVRDLERDFALVKVSGFVSLVYRPARQLQVALGQSVEDNDVRLFQFNSIAAYLACNSTSSGTGGSFSSALSALLRIPDGESLVIAQRLSVAWDRRDNAFNAHRGTYVFLGAELVNSLPEGAAVKPNGSSVTCSVPNADALQPAPLGVRSLRSPYADGRGVHPSLKDGVSRARAPTRRKCAYGIVSLYRLPVRHDQSSLLYLSGPPLLHGGLRLHARMAARHVHAPGLRR